MQIGRAGRARSGDDHPRTTPAMNEPSRGKLVVGDENRVARHAEQPREHPARRQMRAVHVAPADECFDLPADLSMQRRGRSPVERDRRQKELT